MGPSGHVSAVAAVHRLVLDLNGGREQTREYVFQNCRAEGGGNEREDRAGPEARMAAWTRKNGKNDALNPYSKQNYPH